MSSKEKDTGKRDRKKKKSVKLECVPNKVKTINISHSVSNTSNLQETSEDPGPLITEAQPASYVNVGLSDETLTTKEKECLDGLLACCTAYSLSSVENDPFKSDVRFKMLDDIRIFVDIDDGRVNEQIFAMVVRLFSTDVCRPLPPSDMDNIELEDDELRMDPLWPLLFPVYRIFTRILECPSFNVELGKKYVTEKFVLALLEMFNVENAMEREALRTLLHRIYSKILQRRPYIRKQMNFVFYRVVQEQEPMNGLCELLEIYASIISGYNVPLRYEHKESLLYALVPLFKTNQLPTFYPQLVCCVVQFLDKDPSLTDLTVTRLLKYWPKTCSQKEVIFLSTIEEILDIVEADTFARVQTQLFQKIANCITSSHFQVAERALYFWNNDYFITLLNQNKATLMPILFPAVYRAKDHWNKNIVALAYNVLKFFSEIDSTQFDRLVQPYLMNKNGDSHKLV